MLSMNANNSSEEGNLSESIPSTSLYRPSANSYTSSTFGFFIIEENWSEESLIALKQKAGLYKLIALQTTDKCIDRFNVIDAIIICQFDEVQHVMTVIESVVSSMDMIGFDYADIMRACGSESTARFIQASAMSTPDTNKEVEAVNQLVSQILEKPYIRYMLIDYELDHELTLKEMTAIKNALYHNRDYYIEIMSGNRLVQNSNRCWIGVIYSTADEMYGVEVPLKTDSQNKIEEYLQRQGLKPC